MKTKKVIIFIILISTLFSLIFAGCSNKMSNNRSITIQSTEINLSHENLMEAERIIKSRLNRYDSATFEISEIAGKNQLKISFSEDWNLNGISQLLTQKGELKFCTSLNPKPIITENDIQSTDWKKMDAKSDNYDININLKQSAINVWANATGKNIGNSIAIVLDGKVLAAPIVRSEIKNGKCQVSGNFNESEAKLIAILMSSKLPCTFEIVK